MITSVMTIVVLFAIVGLKLAMCGKKEYQFESFGDFFYTLFVALPFSIFACYSLAVIIINAIKN